MYQNNYSGGVAPPTANMNNYYNNAYGFNPQQQYQRYNTGEVQSNITPVYSSPMNNQFLKGRPVSSFEEARAAQVDFDGSLHIFTDIGNQKIYTKQINLDGTATLHTYQLIDGNSEEESHTQSIEYVTKEEFNQALSQIQAALTARVEDNKSKSLNNF